MAKSLRAVEIKHNWANSGIDRAKGLCNNAVALDDSLLRIANRDTR
jgi:hypothetical protein